MASPFASVAEISPATLTYLAVGTSTLTDPITGLQYGASTSATITAYVKSVKGQSTDQSELALNPFSQRVKVYCIEPMFLPAAIGQGSTFDYSFKDPSRVAAGGQEKTVTGKLTITQYIPSQITIVNEELGDVFYGYLLLDGDS